MITCTNCRHGPPDDRDSVYCATVAHHVFHETPACRAYADRRTPAPPADTPIVAAVRRGNVIQCGHCGSLNMSSTICRQCGMRWRLP